MQDDRDADHDNDVDHDSDDDHDSDHQAMSTLTRSSENGEDETEASEPVNTEQKTQELDDEQDMWHAGFAVQKGANYEREEVRIHLEAVRSNFSDMEDVAKTLMDELVGIERGRIRK